MIKYFSALMALVAAQRGGDGDGMGGKPKPEMWTTKAAMETFITDLKGPPMTRVDKAGSIHDYGGSIVIDDFAGNEQLFVFNLHTMSSNQKLLFDIDETRNAPKPTIYGWVDPPVYM